MVYKYTGFFLQINNFKKQKLGVSLFAKPQVFILHRKKRDFLLENTIHKFLLMKHNLVIKYFC